VTRENASVVRTEVDDYEAELRELIREYYEFADELARDYFEELTGIAIDEAVESDIDRLASADVDGPLFVALDGSDADDPEADRRVVGSVQLKRLDATTAEVKRLYVAPAYRGEGLGRELMETLVAGAERDGFRTLRLGVGPYLETAQSLYEDLGFEYTTRYDRSNAPEAITDEWHFMRLDLA